MARKIKAKKKVQCSSKGCRRYRVNGTDFCPDHEPVDPVSLVKKLTEVERLRFFEADIAMRNDTQEIKIISQESVIDRVSFDNRNKDRQNRIDALKVSIATRSDEQKAMLAVLSKKYGFDPRTVSLDDKTGVIHEHHG